MNPARLINKKNAILISIVASSELDENDLEISIDER